MEEVKNEIQSKDFPSPLGGEGGGEGYSNRDHPHPTPLPSRERGEICYIAVGSNLGDREATIRRALELLGQVPGVRILKVSALRETRPVGPQDQPDYLNGVALLETRLAPLELLDHLQAIERQLGRTRGTRWGPRTIDLDILYYGHQSLRHPRLTVPHPEIENRPFLKEAVRELCGLKEKFFLPSFRRKQNPPLLPPLQKGGAGGFGPDTRRSRACCVAPPLRAYDE